MYFFSSDYILTAVSPYQVHKIRFTLVMCSYSTNGRASLVIEKLRQRETQQRRWAEEEETGVEEEATGDEVAGTEVAEVTGKCNGITT